MADLLARAPWSGTPPAVPPICHISAGRLSLRVFEAFRSRFGVALRPNYGQTENGFITVDTGPEDEVRPGSVGRPSPGIEVRIGDDPCNPVPHGRLGRVWYKSPWYMEGYGFPGRLAARESFDGWWPTQDLGSLDETNRLTVAGIPGEPRPDRGRADEPSRGGRRGRLARSISSWRHRRRSRGECPHARSRRRSPRRGANPAAPAGTAGRRGDESPPSARKRQT